MDLSHFIEHFSNDMNIARNVALYIIKPDNLSEKFQKKNYFRGGIGGSREVSNIDRSATASGANSRASSLYSRAAMYFNNFIQGGTLVAALILEKSVVNSPSGPIMTRILQETNPDDRRPAYALKGKTMGLALEKLYHISLDKMKQIRRSRTDRVEWFETTQNDFKNAKLALQSVGHGRFFDFSLFPRNVMPEDLVGKGVKLSRGQVLDTTTFELRKSKRLLEMMDDVTEEDGSVKLTLEDIEDVRSNSIRGQQILELITRKGPQKSATTQTTDAPTQAIPQPMRTRSRANQTQNPVYVRLTRSKINQLRAAAQTDNLEAKRKKIARVLAQLS